MSYLLLSKYPPLCIRTIYGCIIISQNYKITNYKITNYIKVVGVCLPAAKEQKFIIIYNIYIIYNNKNIYIINYYFIHYKTIIFYLFGTIRKV